VEIIPGVLLDREDVSSVEGGVRLEGGEGSRRGNVSRDWDGSESGEGGSSRNELGRLEGRGSSSGESSRRGSGKRHRNEGSSSGSRKRGSALLGSLPRSRHEVLGEISSEREGGIDSVEEGRLSVDNDSLNDSGNRRRREGRPGVGSTVEDRLPVDVDLDVGLRLLGEIEDGSGVVVESKSDVLEGESAVGDGGEEEREGFLNSSPGRDLLLEIDGELVGDGSDREGIDDREVVPENLLILDGGKASRSRELLLGEEERVDGDVAGNLKSLLLSESDEVDIVSRLDVGDVNASAVEVGEEEDRGEVGGLRVGHDGLVLRPGGEVMSDGSDLVDVVGGKVGRNEEGSSSRGDVVSLEPRRVVGRSGDSEEVVAVGVSLGVRLSDLKRDLVLDPGSDSLGKDLDHGESSSNGGFGDLGEVLGRGLSDSWDEGLDRDESGEGEGLVGGLVVDAGDLERGLPDDRLDEELRALDVGDERDGVVDGHSSRLVSSRDVGSGSSVSVVRGKVDVEVDEVLREMLLERVLRLLGVLRVVGSEVFEVLDGDSVLLEREKRRGEKIREEKGKMRKEKARQ